MSQLETDSAAAWLDVVELLSLCDRRLRDTLSRSLTQEGLGDAQYSLLWRCSSTNARGVPQRHLAEELSVSAAHVSTTLEQLRCLGLLCSRRLPNDRRRQLWAVTPSGREVIRRVTSSLRAWASRLENTLGTQASHELRSTLRALVTVSIDPGTEDRDKSEQAPPADPFREKAA